MKDCAVWMFDCDGVILDSNSLKTEAFWETGSAYGKKDGQALVDYHIQHGGISRYQKFEVFFRDIRGEIDYDQKLKEALATYANLVRHGLLHCPEVPGIRDILEFLKENRRGKRFVVSGSDQAELREIFSERDLGKYFDGVFGCPDSKSDIVGRRLKEIELAYQDSGGVFFGDSRIDFEVAQSFGLQFVMLYGYSEWRQWRAELSCDVISGYDFTEIMRTSEMV